MKLIIISLMDFSASACTKLILAGEHLVVHGYNGIAIPLFQKKTQITLSDQFTETKINNQSLTKEQFQTFLKDLEMYQHILNFNESASKQLKTFNFEINLPDTGVGLGSSASFAVTMLKVLSSFLEKPLSTEDLLEFTALAEKHYHGNPSGIDHSTIILEQPILFYGKNKTCQPLEFNLPSFIQDLQITNTGKPKESTKQMVDYVTSKLSTIPIQTLEDLNSEVPNLIKSLKSNNLSEFKRIINLYGQFLESIPICTQKVIKQNQVIRLKQGAAKVCGAGGLTNASGITISIF